RPRLSRPVRPGTRDKLGGAAPDRDRGPNSFVAPGVEAVRGEDALVLAGPGAAADGLDLEAVAKLTAGRRGAWFCRSLATAATPGPIRRKHAGLAKTA